MRNLTVSTRVRPGRMAVLVDLNDTHWQGSCLRVIEYFTRLWGGCGNIIIPTDGKEISPLFWKILERFDPDYVDAYGRTGRDVEIEEPAEFEQAYQRHIAGWEQQSGGKCEPYAAEEIRARLRETHLTQFGISAELQTELRDRLAPFYFQQWIVEAGLLGAAGVPHYPHTNVVEILPYAQQPQRVFRLKNVAPFSALWWAASFGHVNAEMEGQLAKIGVEVTSQGSTAEEIRFLIRLAVKGYEEIESSSFFANTSLKAISQILESMPFHLSMAGLGSYRSIRHRHWDEPVVAVAGKSLQDFALYYAISRMRTRVAWIPPCVLDEVLASPPARETIDEAWCFVNDLASLARGNSRRHEGMVIVSSTLEDAQLEQVKTAFSSASVGHLQRFQVGRPEQVIPAEPLRLYETNNISVLRSIAVADDGTIPLFETPLPKSFSKVDPVPAQVADRTEHQRVPRPAPLCPWRAADGRRELYVKRRTHLLQRPHLPLPEQFHPSRCFG